MKKCCLCGKKFLGKGLEIEGVLLPEVCGKPCLERELKEVSGELETEIVQSSSHEEVAPLQGFMLVVEPA